MSYLKQHIINLKNSSTLRNRRIIYGNPSPGSLGDYWLLIEEYNKLDPEWKDLNPNKWKSIHFNEEFSRYMLKKFKELHCEFCGKEDLVIYKWYEHKDFSIMCTVDHFLPKSKYPELTYNSNNLYICCNKCNQNKSDDIVDISNIKFGYSNEIRGKFKFSNNF